MPSVKNPNGPSKNRLAARAAKTRQQRQKSSAAGQQTKARQADMRRGARAGLMPTSGPNKPVSAKKQRKLDKRLQYALKRQMEAEEAEGEVEGEAEGEVEVDMKDAQVSADATADGSEDKAGDVDMEAMDANIS